MIICETGDINMLELLFTESNYQDLDINHQDDEGNTALMITCEKGFDSLAKLLLVNLKKLPRLKPKRNHQGYSALNLAEKNLHLACAKLIIEFQIY
jgi:ankyrin repeat protein